VKVEKKNGPFYILGHKILPKKKHCCTQRHIKSGQIQKSKKDEFNSIPHENLYTTEFEAYLKLGSLHIQLKQQVAISTHTTNT